MLSIERGAPADSPFIILKVRCSHLESEFLTSIAESMTKLQRLALDHFERCGDMRLNLSEARR
jgi:hypothetical protein